MAVGLRPAGKSAEMPSTPIATALKFYSTELFFVIHYSSLILWNFTAKSIFRQSRLLTPRIHRHRQTQITSVFLKHQLFVDHHFQKCNNFIFGKGPSIIVVSPSRKDKKIKKIAASTEEIKTEKRSQDTVELEIANGNGVNGMAGRLQNFLKEKGFKVVKITNANTFEHITTKIFYYSGHRKDVDHLIQEIAFSPDERSIIELKNFGRRIKIIIGKDIMRQNEVLAKAKFTRN